MAAAMWTYFIPLYILGGLLLIVALFAVLGRIRGGRYLRPIIAGLSRAPLIGRFMQRLTRAALERANPELASAVIKLERLGATRDPQRAQSALSQLSAAERRAYLEAAKEQGAMPSPTNRAERRRMERARKR